ncbi:MAG: VWA domain-containing protein, partial [Candidatus Thorarchaeota archaeon]|nr:VWA domain-containing protein [Candidatus Thorarchaeota archaeon]
MSRSDSLDIAAQRAWSQAISDFYHPPLPDPVIEYKEDTSSYFYIDSNDWTVHLNTAGVPLNLDPNDAEPYLRSVCHHEIQHYLVCPFDGVTNGMMFAAARKHLSDSVAMFVCNIFADLVVDSGLLKRFPTLSHSRINTSIHDSAVRTRDHSPLWQLVVASYRFMWGFPVPHGVNIDVPTIDAAREIVEVSKKYMIDERKWPKATEDIAKIVAKWLPEDEEDMGGMEMTSSSGNSDGGGESGEALSIPRDLDGIMGSPVEDRNGDRARKCADRDSIDNHDEIMERLAIEVEERGGSLKDLEAVYVLYSGGTGSNDWVRFWYRAKVRGLLRFQVRHKRSVGATPLATEAWRLGDPIEELDIVQSLQAFPILVPNMSTRRWMKSVYFGNSQQDELPDLLVVLDSSGSMTYKMGARNLQGPYHVALVSSLAAMDTALRRGCRVAGINFSGNIITCKWTRDRSEVEDTLMAYQGGGTVMPVKQIKQLCEEAGTEVMTVIITDAGVSNWGPFVKTVSQLSRIGHNIFIFHIGARKGKTTKAGKALTKVGGVVIPVTSIKELPG